MGKIENFEELNCWKKARELVKLIYLECDSGKLAKDFDTKSQFKRAALSIMNNIAEGFSRKSDKEFIRFLEYSESSAAEVKSMLYVLQDINYFSSDKASTYHNQVTEVRKLILGLIRYLRSKPTQYLKEDLTIYETSEE